VFLRKLEYFHGILFLTTTQAANSDDAILNRIHLKLRYDDLDRDARRNVFVKLLKTGEKEWVEFSQEELDRLAEVKSNGREVSLNRDFEKPPLSRVSSNCISVSRRRVRREIMLRRVERAARRDNDRICHDRFTESL
jgi:hypothetical protein